MTAPTLDTSAPSSSAERIGRLFVVEHLFPNGELRTQEVRIGSGVRRLRFALAGGACEICHARLDVLCECRKPWHIRSYNLCPRCTLAPLPKTGAYLGSTTNLAGDVNKILRAPAEDRWRLLVANPATLAAMVRDVPPDPVYALAEALEEKHVVLATDRTLGRESLCWACDAP